MSDNEISESIAVQILGQPTDPRSLHRILPKAVVSACFTIDDKVFEKTDKRILDKLIPDRQVRLSRLRENFWLQVHANSQHGRQITMKMLVHGICSPAGLKQVLADPDQCAFLFRPPANYELALRECLTVAVDQIRDILGASHYDVAGQVDPKMADVKRRIFENIADRVKGMPVQRTENINVNKEIGIHQSFEDAIPTTPDEIDAKIKKLESELDKSKKVKDVTPRKDD